MTEKEDRQIRRTDFFWGLIVGITFTAAAFMALVLWAYFRIT